MNVGIIALMLGVSLVLGFFGLLAFVWGLKNGQFDDENKMMEGVLFDSPEDLNKVASAEDKQDFLQELTHNPKHK
ncbi:cbb3-type cytochrome oxidase assembly protein CcoS [Helicobacter sp. MIT 00-7814]|uniref:cbb3-type cytochrome oxidase assembly protein CcoS n=1 Tax=unclassified Helicobacter TaxID=2593540 RepID=UPI000E1EE7C5|nr:MULTISPECIES: cbb3-type cytochrome oxidase assembly protein CcoS [unclassified Helicobacter]RDU55533.1 cbb3-type cytochrome oxidase assembly protein CcoS [Helicobacter sp. MIT 99-10781]RDU55623.1 cbb3-type cytochrome oxidase assembly protein CcoS [Helicobacter sp. MIT 00-7814]